MTRPFFLGVLGLLYTAPHLMAQAAGPEIDVMTFNANGPFDPMEKLRLIRRVNCAG